MEQSQIGFTIGIPLRGITWKFKEIHDGLKTVSLKPLSA